MTDRSGRIRRWWLNGGIFPTHRWGIDWWWELDGTGKTYWLRIAAVRFAVGKSSR